MLNLPAMLIKSAKPIALTIAKAKILTMEVTKADGKATFVTCMVGVEIIRGEVEL